MKRIAADKAKRRGTVINNLHDFYEAVKHSNIKVTCLPRDVLQNQVKNLGLQKLFKTANKIPDIKKYHYVESKDKDLKQYSSQQSKQTATSKNSEAIAMKENDIQSNLTIGQFIAVHIESEKQKNTANIYIAETVEVDEADVGLRYMTRAGNKYTWQKKNEYSWQP